MNKMTDKQKRLPNDPEGYEPIFDNTSVASVCEKCALFLKHTADCLMPDAPCQFYNRPEERGIHYVKSECAKEVSRCLGEMQIYKPKHGDCSNGGISNQFDVVKIWSGFDLNAPPNAVVIVEDKICGNYRIRAVPANKGDKWDMFGGCFVYTSNGVVPHHDTPIKLFDRFE